MSRAWLAGFIVGSLAIELRARVEDLAVVRAGELLGSDGIQCWATADWVGPRSIGRKDQAGG